MKTLRISAAIMILGFTGYAGAALAQQTAPPPAQTTDAPPTTAPAPVQDPVAQPTPDPTPQADSATTSASPTSATAADEKATADPDAAAKTKVGKKHKKHPTDEPSPDAPKPQ